MRGRWFESNLGQNPFICLYKLLLIVISLVVYEILTLIIKRLRGRGCCDLLDYFAFVFCRMKFWARKFFRNRVLANFIYEFAVLYPTPSNLSYF